MAIVQGRPRNAGSTDEYSQNSRTITRRLLSTTLNVDFQSMRGARHGRLDYDVARPTQSQAFIKTQPFLTGQNDLIPGDRHLAATTFSSTRSGLGSPFRLDYRGVPVDGDVSCRPELYRFRGSRPDLC